MITKGLVEVDDILKYLFGVWSFLFKKDLVGFFFAVRVTFMLPDMCFVHPTFRFWFLVTYDDKVTKIQKYYVIFVYILQGKMGKTQKIWKENHATKVTKIPKTKEVWDEQNNDEFYISYPFFIILQSNKQKI